ncbi:MAG TPA: copper amine oxidase N-terminal domain-containing protein [Armatimonadota bacterium]
MSVFMHWMLLGVFLLLPLLINEQARPLLAASVPVESTPQTLELVDTVMVPASFLAQWLGGTVTSDRKTGQVMFTAQGKTLQLASNSPQATMAGQALTLGQPVLDVAGTVYLPLVPVAKIFGAVTARTADGLAMTLTDPVTKRTVDLPLRGRIFVAEGDQNGDGSSEIAYGAYLYFANQLNKWYDGRSVSNPNLPLVWVVKGRKNIWSRQVEGYELTQLFQGDLEGAGRSELWYTSLLPAADHVEYYFHAFTWNGRTFRNIIAAPKSYLQYNTGGGLVAWISHRPTQLILFTPIFGEVHANGPIALQVATYAWNGTYFMLRENRRSRQTDAGDPIAILRDEFRVPVTEHSADRIRQNLVAFQ